MNRYKTFSITALAGLLGHVPAEGFWGYFKKSPTVRSFHERYQGDGIFHRQRVMQLRKEGSSVQKFVRSWCNSEHMFFFKKIAPYVSPTCIEQIQKFRAHSTGNENPHIIPCSKTPLWAVDQIKKLVPHARIPGENLIVMTGNRSASGAARINKTTFKLEISPLALAIGKERPIVFNGVVLHELAHMSLQHGNAQRIIERELAENLYLDRKEVLKQLSHLQEFEADTYLTTDSYTHLAACHAYFDAIGDAFKTSRSHDSETHPSIDRRCQNLKTISELLAVEAATLD
jgi:predicted SprT family Zn-dependent metalloprotease